MKLLCLGEDIMANIKVNHFGSKTIDVNNTVRWEEMLTELVIAIALGAFAYMGYKASIAILFFGCGGACLVSLLYFLHTAYMELKEKWESKKQNL
jgi:hypothetical protein